ncbi:leucine rich repeat protein, partial [Leptospira weilii str. Ecochallenge]
MTYFQSVNIRFKKRFIIPLLICLFCELQAQPNEEQTYRTLTKALKNPKDVRVLNLSGDRLTTLPKEIGKLRNLQILYLSGNQFKALPKEIGQLQNL